MRAVDRVKRHLQQRHGVNTYGEIGLVVMGVRGQQLVEGMLVLTQFGFCVVSPAALCRVW